MAAGVALGRFLKNGMFKGLVGWAQTAVTLLLIACMGHMLGSRDTFPGELGEIGLTALLHCVVPTFVSVMLVWAVTRFALGEKRKDGRP